MVRVACRLRVAGVVCIGVMKQSTGSVRSSHNSNCDVIISSDMLLVGASVEDSVGTMEGSGEPAFLEDFDFALLKDEDEVFELFEEVVLMLPAPGRYGKSILGAFGRCLGRFFLPFFV